MSTVTKRHFIAKPKAYGWAACTLAAVAACAAPTARGADFTITFFQQTGGHSGMLADYTTFTGSISVADSAVVPGALLLWNTPGITGFSVDIAGANATYRYRLFDDIFPPLDNPNTLSPIRQGLQFDSAGQPEYFFSPDSGQSYIIDTADRPGYGQKPELAFVQNSTLFDHIVVDQSGNFIRRANLPPGQTPLYVIAGEWRFDSGYTPQMPDLDRYTGYYMITQAVPETGTSALLLGGLIMLGLMRRLRQP